MDLVLTAFAPESVFLMPMANAEVRSRPEICGSVIATAPPVASTASIFPRCAVVTVKGELADVRKTTSFQSWAEASALTRLHADAVLDVAYGGGEKETLDIFRTAQANAPTLVFIHGGYWRSLDKSDHSFVAPSFTADGALVVVPLRTAKWLLLPALSPLTPSCTRCSIPLSLSW